MTKIYTTTNYQITIPTIIDVDINNTLTHPNILKPCKLEHTRGHTILSYNVLTNGMTLCEYISNKRSDQNTSRFTSLRHLSYISPIDIMLQIICACEFMISHGALSSQTYICPKTIWIEFSDKPRVYIMDICEHKIDEKQDYLHTRSYWAPEVLVSFNNKNFYDRDVSKSEITKMTSTLKRYNTRPSTITITYTLINIVFYCLPRRTVSRTTNTRTRLASI